MFDLDLWREIFQSINKNRTRSLLSGFTVAFAILLFTILFSFSIHAQQKELDGGKKYTINSIEVTGEQHFNENTVIAFTGLKGPVRDKMIKSGFMKKANEDHFFMSIQEAVDWYTTGLKKDKFHKYLKQKNHKKPLFKR